MMIMRCFRESPHQTTDMNHPIPFQKGRENFAVVLIVCSVRRLCSDCTLYTKRGLSVARPLHIKFIPHVYKNARDLFVGSRETKKEGERGKIRKCSIIK